MSLYFEVWFSVVETTFVVAFLKGLETSVLLPIQLAKSTI